MWWWALSVALAGDCPEIPVSAVAYQSEVAGAVLSFLAADVSSFESGRDAALERLPCVGEPLGPGAVLALYQLEAFDGFYSRDEARRDSGLRALKARFPDYDLPSQFSSTHPLREAWNEQRKKPVASGSEMPVPLDRILWIDGEVKLEWPADRVVLFQVMDSFGAVQQTRLYPAGSPVPEYESAGDGLRDAYLRQAVIRQRRPVELAVLSGVSAVASTTFLVLNRSSYSKWNSLQGNPEVALDPATIAEADDYASNSRTYGITSGVTGVLALGLGITAAVTW